MKNYKMDVKTLTATVYVIGAGASYEVKLPTGEKLKKQISSVLNINTSLFGNLINGDETIFDALQILASETPSRKINPFLDAAKHIKDAMPLAQSIDNFIDQHPYNAEIVLCGKLAIAKLILESEEKSLLNINNSGRILFKNTDALEKTWYTPFFQTLTEHCSKDQLEERFKAITLIIFNYDRCVEHFLYCALQINYGMSSDEAAELVNSIKIYHPYGSVGTLPYFTSNGSVGFGEKLGAIDLVKVAKQIKTFTEGTDPKSTKIKEIKTHVDEAKKLIFLGFAFHKLNMQLVTPKHDNSKITPTVRCYATTLGFSDLDKEIIKEQIEDLYRYRHSTVVKMSNTTCYGFFDEFKKRLTF